MPYQEQITKERHERIHPDVVAPLARRESLRDAQAKQTRTRVLESAVACIDELGIARASSNEIARRAGMTWGAIQHHFGSREDLLLSVIESNFAEL